MQDKYQNPSAINSDDGVVQPPQSGFGMGFGQSDNPGALSSYDTGAPIQPDGLLRPPDDKPSLMIRIVKRADVVLGLLLIVGIIGVFIVTSSKKDDQQSANNAGLTEGYDTQKIPLDDFAAGVQRLNIGASSVLINGLAELNGGVVVSPSPQPASPKAGQIYYDQNVNQLAYYNGENFIPVGTGVTSVQGQSGVITLTAGPGIAIDGTKISSTVTGGSGTVSSPGGTTGRIAKFTGVQSIADSLLSESGATVNVAGDLAVTSALTLGSALSVANGGTGAISLAANGVLVGNGSSPVTSVTAGAAGECLLSTAGAPAFAACPGGGGGVSSLNGQTGVVNIANASGAAGTVTINDATTAAKGIASFNSTNFSVAGGAVNTIQNINTGATPTFAGVNTNSINPSAALTVGSTSQALTLQGNGTTVLTATSLGNTTTVGFVAPTANTTINFPALSAGTYQLCTSSGNCLGGGSGAANTALSNLTGVAINTTLLPGSAGAVSLGSGTLPFGDLFIAGTSGTPGTNNFRITGASTGGLRTITLPDATGTVCLTSGNCAGVGGTGDILQGGNSFTAAMTIGTNDAFDLNLETAGVTRLTVESDGSQVTFASNVDLILQGATAYISNTQGQTASEAFGQGANVGSSDALAVGNTAAASSSGATAIGRNAWAQNNNSIAIGVSSHSNGIGGIAIGPNANVASDSSIAIGSGAATTAANQAVFGSSSAPISQVVVGNGVTNASPAAFVLQGTSGSGTDIAGADVTIAGGQSTGNAFGGSINFNVSTPGLSGTTTNSLTNVASIGGASGAALFQNAVDTTQAFRIRTSSSNNLLVVDTVNSRVGVALGGNTTPSLANEGLEVKGAIRISGASMDTYTTPGAAGIGARFSVVNADMSASNQVIAVGVTAASHTNSRGITVLDARASAHQPSIAVISPNENEIGGFSWDGSSTAFLVKNSAASGSIGLNVAGTTQLTVGTADVTLATNIDLLLQGATAYISNPQTQSQSEAFGLSATVSGSNAVALGYGATSAADGVAIGQGAVAVASAISIGQLAGVSSGSFGGPVSIGDGANAASWGVALGSGSSTSGNWGTSVGQGAVTSGQLGTAVGNSSNAGSQGVALGADATTGGNNRIVIGYSSTATADNQFVVGGSTTDGSYVNDVYLGSGVTDTTPQSVVIQGTGGSGANVAGASVTLAGGRSTGNANGGSLNFQISAPGGSGSSLNGLTTVATLSGSNGAATFQNAANSASAFRILTSGSAEVLGADTVNSIVSLLGSNPAALPSWTTNSNNIPAARFEHASVTANGYVYVIAGDDGSDVPTSTVYYAKLNADGSVGTWASTTALPQARTELSAVTANGYVYAIGGRNSSQTVQTTVYYAKLNADGTVGSWNTTTVLPAERTNHTSLTANGYVYVLGGDSTGGTTSTVYYARLNSDGTVGSWNTTTAFSASRRYHATVAANGYVYALGGTVGGSDSTEVTYAKLNTDGTVGSWSTTTALPDTRTNGAAGVLNGYVYFLGGQGTDYADTFYAQLNADGTIGSWTQSTDMNTSRRSLTAVTGNGYIYAIGGENGAALTSQEYASPARVRVGASLDLVGLSGENLAEGGSGGHLTAGDTHIAGLLTVTDRASFMAGATVDNNLTVQAQNDSSAVFTILNGSAVPVFSVDTTNARIYVGNSTADSTGALLVLDTKNTAGDPTGVNGGMYYNSSSNKMRCYENSGWRDCIHSARTEIFVSSDFMSNGSDGNFVFGTNGGAGSATSSTATTSVAGHPGIIQQATGTTAGGRASIIPAAENGILLGNNDLYSVEIVSRITTLSDGTDTYTYRAGFIDDNDVEPTDGCYFRYTHGTLSGRWQGVCRSNTTESTCDTSITVAAGTWYRLTVTVNAAGTSADFMTDGVSRCQVTTNIPTGAGRGTSFGSVIKKSLGTTSRTVDVDYIEMLGSLNTPR